MKKILLLNLGSTSFKFKLFSSSNDGDKKLQSTGKIENIGSSKSDYEYEFGNEERQGQHTFNTHTDALSFSLDQLVENNQIGGLEDIDAVGYKAILAGDVDGPQLVTEELLKKMESYIPLAPAHNPMYIKTMRDVSQNFPKLKQIACFETTFHSTVPNYRRTYGVPYEWQEKYGIRRYGFHGASHEYISQRIKELSPSARKIISLHLGGSSSICAIEDGKSIATSMGATPQSGLFQNNRVGDFDIFCLPRLLEEYDGVEEILKELSTKSGFLGISGVSNDLRDVIQASDEGNAQAKLAIEAFVDNIVGYIGMQMAYLGGVDSIVFTGGIGENSHVIREKVCKRLGFLGVILDDEVKDSNSDIMITSKESKTEVWVINTDEELVLTQKVLEFLAM